MPIYEFICSDCETVFDEWFSSSRAASIPDCPHCSGRKVERRLSVFGISGSAVEKPVSGSGKGGCAHCSSHNCSTCR